VLSTLPAIVTVLLGMWASNMLQQLERHVQKTCALLLYGGALLLAGLLLSSSFPVNKNVWSSSFVLLTAGLASLLWAFLIFLMDEKGRAKWARPGIVFGANAITAYILHYLLFYPFGYLRFWGYSIQYWVVRFFSGIVPAEMASLLWAILFTAFCYLPVWWMYRKKIWIKI